MAILDRILGRKKEDKKPVEKSARGESAFGGKKPKAIKSEKLRPQSASGKAPKKTVKTKKVLKKEENIAHWVLLEPLVTEKSTSLGQFNKYVFRVDQGSGKNQIKEAVQNYYGVGVTGVNIIKIHPKKRIHGRTVGWKKGYKKAIVTLQEGDTIGVVEGV